MVVIMDVKSGGSVQKFNKHVGGATIMILYYSDSCGYCNDMKKDWLKFEEESIQKPYNITIARVNSNNIRDINADKDVLGYPSIFHLFNGKKKDEFKGERTTEGFHKFLEDISKKMELHSSNKNNVSKKDEYLEPTLFSIDNPEYSMSRGIHPMDTSISLDNDTIINTAPVSDSKKSNSRTKTRTKTRSKSKSKSKSKKSRTKSKSKSKSAIKSSPMNKTTLKKSISNTQSKKSRKIQPSITSTNRYPFSKSFSI